MLGDVGGNTASDGPTVEENVFLVNFHDLIDEIIDREGVFLQLFGVFSLVAMETIAGVLHSEYTDTEAFLQAIKHVVAHS